MMSKLGYGIGMAASIGAGLAVGTGEARIAKGAYDLFKNAHSASTVTRAGKTAVEANRVFNLTKESSQAITKISAATKNTGLFVQNGVTKEGVKFDLDALSKAGQILNRNGLTKAGRALQKHGGRPGSVFPRPNGNVTRINQHGQDILDNILTHPDGVVHFRTHKQFDDIIDIKAPNIGGVRFTKSKEMIGLLEP
jgi:hypothetical protein